MCKHNRTEEKNCLDFDRISRTHATGKTKYFTIDMIKRVQKTGQRTCGHHWQYNTCKHNRTEKLFHHHEERMCPDNMTEKLSHN